MLFLVVDDDALSRDLLTLVLESEGYEVEVAASGDAAVARVRLSAAAGRPISDIVLTDIQMPGLAGDALATALKPLLPRGTMLLAMSGSQPAAAALAGFDGFLLKPFQVGELRSMIAAGASGEKRESLGAQLAPGSQDALFVESGSAALDEEIFAKMCELMPVAQLGQMYALCIEDARTRIAHMETLAALDDDTQYRSEAHAVKGGCGMIGASELYLLAAAAERDGLAAGDASPGTSTVTATLAQLSSACDRLERILLERARE